MGSCDLIDIYSPVASLVARKIIVIRDRETYAFIVETDYANAGLLA